MAHVKPRILFFNPVRHARSAYEALHAVAAPEVVTSKSRVEFFSDLRTKYNDIRAIYRTSASGAVSIDQPPLLRLTPRGPPNTNYRTILQGCWEI